jgi:TetR/AcrR family transcriptional regulator, mexJK operon transcriptional repressor
MKPRRLPDEAKHAAILKSAVKLFLKKGFHNTTMDAIADAARVTKQTVYAHYHSKEELFKQMISELCRKHTPEASLLADPGKKVEALLFELGLGFFNMLQVLKGWLRHGWWWAKLRVTPSWRKCITTVAR